MSLHNPYHWIERVCEILLIPVAHESWRYFTAWGQCEGGAAANNPLNTTYHMPGSTTLSGNPDGVQNYVNAVQGICATACTIAQNSAYLNLWKDLQANRYRAEDVVERNRDAIATWGTNPDNILSRLKAIA